MFNWRKGCVIVLLCLIQSIVFAQQVIPDELKPWQDWVLRDDSEAACPRPYNQANQFVCSWPANLKLNAQDTKASFEQKGIQYQAGWVMLPGDKQNWPIDVVGDEKTLSVIDRFGKPHVFLEKGDYQIQGAFQWPQMPEQFAIPQEVGLVDITVNQSKLTSIELDNRGYVWLRKKQVVKPVEEKQADSLEVKVFRKIQDSIPQEQLILLRLKVTGKEREVKIGPVTSSQSSPLYIRAPIPTRLEKDGLLRLNVKPGTWDVYINSRFLTQENQFTYQQYNQPWPDQEIWVVETQPQFRQIEMSGAMSIDPTQTELPNHWRSFPTFLMKQDTTLKFTEQQRGKVFERGEQLSLQREMWLDFDGKGLTIKDNLNGVIEDNWRLSASAPMKLGRVTINNEDQLITVLPDERQPGVEIRNGRVNLTAVSRIQDRKQALPAIGWDRDVNQLNTMLHLPPGWQLWHVLGVDKADEAWLRNWNLLDLFLVLLIGLSVFKLLGLGWGFFALVTLALIYQEPNAPIYSWLFVLAGLGLLKVMPENSAKKWVKGYTLFSTVTLIMFAIPFLSWQLQTALYPQLNPPDRWAQPYQQSYAKKSRQMIAEGGAADLDEVAREMPGRAMEAMSAPVSSLKSMQDQASNVELREKQMQEYDPEAKVQTGPGLPNWTWQRIPLVWQGPVTKEQSLRLWLIPDWGVSLLKVLQVFLVLGLIFALGRSLYQQRDKTAQPSTPTTNSSMMLVLVLPIMMFLSQMTLMSNAVANVPDQSILQDLRAYLLKAPECMPQCADYNNMQITIEPDMMTLRLKLQAVQDIAMPLPDYQQGWQPDSIILDGKPLKALKRGENGVLWVYVEEGEHELILSGRLSDVDAFAMNFMLYPKSVSVSNQSNNSWTVAGIRDNKLAGRTIQFNRVAPSMQQSNVPDNKTLLPTQMPPFVTFTRTLRLWHDWEIENVITRVSPQKGAIHLKLPLLNEEKVLSEHVPVEDNQMSVQLSQHQRQVVWYSKIPITTKIELSAIDSAKLKEVWQIESLPMWHVNFEGIPLIHQQSRVGQWLPQWHPWPQESLTINVIKPEALAGNTLTIDNSRYSIQPGKRKTEYALDINLRSSQGDLHAITLPENIKIQDILINNLSQPINLEGNQLTFPVRPGSQQVKVKWESDEPLKSNLLTPAVNLGSDSSNHITQVDLSKNRWILWLSGPEVGPVVRYWAVFALTILIAFALGRSGLTPLATWQWLLLGLGVTLSTPLAAVAVVVWFILFELRNRYASKLDTLVFQISQIGLGLMTGIFVVSLLVCITSGLLGNPQMQLDAPSTSLAHSNFLMQAQYQLQWYQDQIQGNLPTVKILTIPLYVYRLIMLAWALWLAFSLLKWFQWGWRCFTKDGIWRFD